VISEGPKNFKIRIIWAGKVIEDHVYTVPKEKCASLEEEVCVVWELWKGRNGRGAYRIERQLYPDKRVPAKNVARQQHQELGRVAETAHGVLVGV
jgi:hypothetical protein